MSLPDDTREMAISRSFDAPPELVYRAFVERSLLGQWFGPLMFPVPIDTISVDARTGGHWRMTMVNKDDPSQKSPIDATLTEVVENQLIAGYEIATGFPGLADGTRLSLSLEFVPEGDGTRLELRQGPFTDDLAQQSMIGWKQSFHKLEALLATPARFRTMSNPTKDDRP